LNDLPGATAPAHADIAPGHSDGELARFTPPEPWPLSAPDAWAPQPGQPPIRAVWPDGSTAWLVSHFEQVRQMVADPRFSRALATAPGRPLHGVEVFAAGTIVGMDPPEHTRLRKLVVSAFTNRRVEAMRPRVAAIVGELIDGFLAGPPPTDLMTNFALPLPVRVICEMLGVPADDLDMFRTWSNAIVGDWSRDSGEILTALAELYGYLAELVKIKEAQPDDDLLSALIGARDSGDRLSEEELVTMGCTLLVGGFETTANMIGLSILALLDNPAELASLRADPELIAAAAEELFRYVRLGVSPMPRVTSEAVELGGITIPAGDAVVPLFATANRDPSVFTDPDRLDFSRTLGSHLGFGAGVHHCLGSHLARVEVQEAMRGLVTRLPGLALAIPAGELRFKPGMAIHNIIELPVTWLSGGC
jgi:cytochrome P450